MADANNRQNSGETAPETGAETINLFTQAITEGTHWYLALLEAIGRWQTSEEEYNGRKYQYLIAQEAFDWLLLAERLCDAAGELIPQDEKIDLLFHGTPPLNLTAEEFRKLIGKSKYHQYLNFFYGIVIEEVLLLTVCEEVRKERHALGSNKEQAYENEAYQRIYGGNNKDELLKEFRREKGYPQRKSTNLTEMNEFTYWRFQYRLRFSDKARIASDTKKALSKLKQLRPPHIQ